MSNRDYGSVEDRAHYACSALAGKDAQFYEVYLRLKDTAYHKQAMTALVLSLQARKLYRDVHAQAGFGEPQLPRLGNG